MIAMPPPKVRVDRVENLFWETGSTEMLLWRADFVVNGAFVVGVIAYRPTSKRLVIAIPTDGCSEPLSDRVQEAVDREFRRLIRFLERAS